MAEIRDEFLSEEDLDLINLADEELEAWWDLWLHQAQITNQDDEATYSHGVFVLMREPRPDPATAG
ncbi:MAG: hypothetical protein MUF69_05755 [Desulfobacterota bacterium]|jgi:hypothetical protein|nr:hypothetical protein [Thermodesulfobacteriota bacterium]